MGDNKMFVVLKGSGTVFMNNTWTFPNLVLSESSKKLF